MESEFAIVSWHHRLNLMVYTVYEGFCSSRFGLRVADVVAVFWLSAILSNRSTSYAWLETLKQIEMDTTLKSPYAIQDKIRKDFSLIKDFLSNFGIVPQNGSDKKRFLLFMAVTRVYQGLALTLIVIFTFLSVQEFSTTSKNASLRILGDKLVESEVKHLFADATIIDASGPIALNDKELLIQVRISQQSGYQRLLTWHLNTARMVVSGPDTLSNP